MGPSFAFALSLVSPPDSQTHTNQPGTDGDGLFHLESHSGKLRGCVHTTFRPEVAETACVCKLSDRIEDARILFGTCRAFLKAVPVPLLDPVRFLRARFMPVFKPRNRLVNFRLSEEEFEKLRASCSLYGARSLSDFARGAVLRSVSAGLAATGEVAEPAEPRFHDSKITSIDRKVHDLESRITELMSLMDGLRGVSADEPVTSGEQTS